ncbi:MAG: Diacylglycerol kinase [Candidatus Nomurabacteria bacterium GW2011_GWF2_35_66]|uniref:Diacylglycerol kinase n=1 Tax=Candidatus Nomurabacteria bacterium GW2011_GWE1_35_16 TaxID=1618761 RepID=A0A0G0B926_9BACT|nr:MAG: Diacylglycerol kinase [Candidatus Nomurabacteria bacterium GW2011_GWF1_34_20]KKP61609.1 MAG: Diacylglycerol kinase [Candidatus Nomurabacteria bacterium GW2011_GWE2_34_25]KKP65903.1 MAG: Diacylglycerol kinase [Candidatus Nomurabacteria bacterium GW2011_GWE1_35_16]KKP82959.1 MAG: Diacylglycerol kinase [Candidatus Nomurabacteria bacterium GW2011_GWF2_35_66]HAE36272.1 diacylglycerol kinase [Candidatus Nomurabacteria bacterium]
MEKISEKKRFSLVARLRSSDHALRGLNVLIKTCHHLWVEIVFIILGIYLGFVLHISNIEWVLVVFAFGLVVIAEAFNTAIEIDIDLTSPTYHPYARDTKDVAGGAVALAVVVAGIMGALIFLPKVIALVF